MAKRKDRKDSLLKNELADRDLRIIGGRLRRSKLQYAPEQTRPMKHRTREALFSLLGDAVKGCWAIDLFAGAGALSFEAISRGAKRATMIERFVPAIKIINANIEALNLQDQAEVSLGDAFRWGRDLVSTGEQESRIVFYCPPYRFYDERLEDMQQLISTMIENDPGDGVHVVEASPEFDFESLPFAGSWDIRSFPPANLGVLFLKDAAKVN